MKKVNVSLLTPGSVAQQDYFSERGEMLLSKNTTVTARHIDMLRKRNIFDLFIKISNEDEELERLLSMNIQGMDALDIEESVKPAANRPDSLRKSLPGALSLPEFRDIKKGKDGLSQLLESNLSIQLDSKLTGRTPDRPTGPALAKSSVQISVSERTVAQKTDASQAYDKAIDDVTKILNYLADGNQVNGADIQYIVKRFLKIFVSDHNILLNISSKKPTTANHLYHHSLNVCLLAINIAAADNYSESQILEIGMGALMHDLGMLLISQNIVTKPGRLDEQEWYEVQKHPILGLHLLERIRQLPESVPFVAYQAHERENRTGYPKQRGSNLIHQYAKIIQVADVYEAMTSPRAYRPSIIPYKAMENVVKMTRHGLLATDMVEAFLRYASLFPVGSLVELNDHRIGKIVNANSHAFAKPVVSVLTDAGGALVDKSKISQIDLTANTDVFITRALPSDYLKNSDIMDGF